MKIRKAGRVKASEVKAYQVANGLQVDGKVGNQTFGHMLDALDVCRAQPDDPGPDAKPEEVNIWHPIVIGIVIAVLIVLVVI